MIEFSPRAIYARFPSQILFTLSLVIAEGLLYLLYPLSIGEALSGLIAGSQLQLWLLVALCAASILVGALRRYYDTRAYAHIYAQLGVSLLEGQRDRRTPAVSRQNAHLSLLTELVSFFEHSVPQLTQHAISLFGTLILLFALNPRIALLCLGAAGLAALVYRASEGRLHRLNQGLNDEAERQVHVLQLGGRGVLREHLGRVAHWKIRLSDLETKNYAIILTGLSALVVGAVAFLGHLRHEALGDPLSVLMYVFNFFEAVLAFPLFFQEWVRLTEISQRLGAQQGPACTGV